MEKRQKLVKLQDIPVEEDICRKICHAVTCQTHGNFAIMVPDPVFAGHYASRILDAVSKSSDVTSIKLRLAYGSRPKIPSKFVVSHPRGEIRVTVHAVKNDMVALLLLPNLTTIDLDIESSLARVDRISPCVTTLSVRASDQDVFAWTAALIARSGIARLDSLKMDNMNKPSGQISLIPILASGLQSLSMVSFKGNDPELTQTITSLLKCGGPLRVLNLASIRHSSPMMQAIATSNSRLKYLSLSHSIDSEACPCGELVSIVQSVSTLKHLELYINVDNGSLQPLLESLLHNSSLKSVGIRAHYYKCVPDDWHTAIRIVARQTTLRVFKVAFRDGYIPPKDVLESLATAISKNTTLREFEFGDDEVLVEMRKQFPGVVERNADIQRLYSIYSLSREESFQILRRFDIRKYYRPRSPTCPWNGTKPGIHILQLARTCRCFYEHLERGTGLPGEMASRITYYAMCTASPMHRDVSEGSFMDLLRTVQRRLLSNYAHAFQDLFIATCLENMLARLGQRLGIHVQDPIDLARLCLDTCNSGKKTFLYKAAFSPECRFDRYRSGAARIMTRLVNFPKIKFKKVELGTWNQYKTFIASITFTLPSKNNASVFVACKDKDLIDRKLAGYRFTDHNSGGVLYVYAPRMFQDQEITDQVVARLRQEQEGGLRMKIVLFLEADVNPVKMLQLEHLLTGDSGFSYNNASLA